MASVDTQEAWLDDIPLEIQTLDDSFPKAIAKYRYPYANGADLEDLGEDEHTVKIRCYFFDNAAQSTFDLHKDLINRLAGKNFFELTHPEYGLMTGMVTTVNVRKDDRKRCAEVDIDFVEEMRGGAIQPTPSTDVDTQAEGSFQQSVDEQTAELTKDLAAVPQTPSFLRQIAAAVGRLQSLVSDVTQPLNSLVATINYATSLPGTILGAIDQAVEREARAYDALKNFPARFMASVDFGLSKIESDLDGYTSTDRMAARAVILKHVRIGSARRLALETAYVYAADSNARRQQQSQGAVTSFDTLGRYTPSTPPDVAPMNVLELESTLAAARTRLQDEVDEARSMQSLKDMALQLQASVTQVKATAEKVITITVDVPVPLHLLCLQYGLPYTDAERLMAINPGIRNPSFTSGKVLIYA